MQVQKTKYMSTATSFVVYHYRFTYRTLLYGPLPYLSAPPVLIVCVQQSRRRIQNTEGYTKIPFFIRAGMLSKVSNYRVGW